MSHRFVAQPHDAGFDLRDFLELVAADAALSQLDIVVAWVKRTGVRAVYDNLARFLERGGTIRAVVGISQGGTSLQGLQAITEVATDAYVFHHPGRTFHPKLFAASGSNTALILVGSHNLTLGGVQDNYEAGVLSTLDLMVDDERAFSIAVHDYVDRLVDDKELCLRLDEALIESLARNDRYPLADEDESRGGSTSEQDPTAEADPGLPPGARIFGTTRFQMRSRKKPIRADRGATPGIGEGATPAEADGLESAAAPEDRVVRRWFKRLPRADAQQLPTSSPSNTMTLVKAGHDIDASTYFREVFFADAGWHASETAGGQLREIASVDVAVTVDEENLGLHTFDVRYTPGYDSDQANRTSEFAWREFGEYLRQHDNTDKYASLERTSAGIYRLLIADNPAGPFLY
ncbi:MAG: hypothetical protein DCC49_06965 [Acidobacteria bacterium]|nr:MAG: hypothetical protein DCC49_06965 [Acidobacteriota bacterium]